MLMLWFQFTPALRRATCGRRTATRWRYRFNSRPPCDGRRDLRPIGGPMAKFQFTPALRRATRGGIDTPDKATFQFTPALRRATGRARQIVRPRHVSIHARLATGDASSATLTRAQLCFNSRPPCDGRRLFTERTNADVMFQFTPALRRATWRRGHVGRLCRCFNSRPPCDGRPQRGAADDAQD